jgi:hypothetical protein
MERQIGRIPTQSKTIVSIEIILSQKIILFFQYNTKQTISI